MFRATSPSGEGVSTPLLAVFEVDESGLITRSMIDYNPEELFPDLFPDVSEEGFTLLGRHIGT